MVHAPRHFPGVERPVGDHDVVRRREHGVNLVLAAVGQCHMAQEYGCRAVPVDPFAEYFPCRRGRVVEFRVLPSGQFQCAVEGPFGESVAPFALPDPCAQHFAALRRPELSPALQPQQLLGAVHHERCDAGVGVDFPVVVHQAAQTLLGLRQMGCVVVQVHHVAVEADAVEEEETYEREQQDRRHQRAVPVGTHSREPFHPFQHGGPPPAFLLTDQVGKQHQTEKRRSDQRQRCEQPEVAQQLRIGEEQSREGADGRYAADGQRIGQIADDLPRIVAVVRMAEYVDRIAQRDAHYDGPRTYGDRRNRMARQRHERQREQRAERHGNQGQQDRELVAEREGDERHDDQDGDVERQHHVALDLAGVVGRHGGSAVIVRRDSCGGVFGVQLLQRRLDPLDQPVADARVAALVVR